MLHSELTDDRRYEARFLPSAGERLVAGDSTDRLQIIALEAPDVLDLLPVERLVPGATSWEQLCEEFAATGRKGGTDFKKWLRGRKRARLDLQHIARATASMQHLPPEVTRILECL